MNLLLAQYQLTYHDRIVLSLCALSLLLLCLAWCN